MPFGGLRHRLASVQGIDKINEASLSHRDHRVGKPDAHTWKEQILFWLDRVHATFARAWQISGSAGQVGANQPVNAARVPRARALMNNPPPIRASQAISAFLSSVVQMDFDGKGSAWMRIGYVAKGHLHQRRACAR